MNFSRPYKSDRHRDQRKKPQKVISLRGIWKGVEISEEDIKKAKNIWEEGIKGWNIM